MEKAVQALFVGLEPSVEERLRKQFSHATICRVTDADGFMALLDASVPQPADAICCGPAISDAPPNELAQSLKAQFPNAKLIFACSEQYAGNAADLHKNGFNQVFFLPLDHLLLDRWVRQTQSEILGVESSEVLPVAVNDFAAGTVLEFDVMVLLPLNQKYVRIFKKGSVVRPEALLRLHEQGIKVIFINEVEEQKFKAYMAAQASSAGPSLAPGANVSPHKSLREIFQKVLAPIPGSFEGGKALMDKAQEIVGQLITETSIGTAAQGFFKHLGSFGGDHYEQSVRVSAYASFFALALKRGRPEDLAVAGLFYHIGLSRCPEELLHKPLERMTNEERAIYMRHPEESLNLVKEKRLVLVPEVQSAILQHHEQPDGKGLPRGLPEAKISPEAQVLSFAIAFDRLTQVVNGQSQLNAEQAAQKLTLSSEVSRDLALQTHKLIAQDLAKPA